MISCYRPIIKVPKKVHPVDLVLASENIYFCLHHTSHVRGVKVNLRIVIMVPEEQKIIID